MLCKVTHCAEHVSANTRPLQLHWGDREMGTAISCTKCSQVAGFIQRVGRSSSEASSLRVGVLRSKIIAIVIVTCYRCTHKRKCVHAAVDLIQRKKLDTRNFYESNLTEARFKIIPGLFSCTGVTGRWGLLSHAQNVVRWLVLSKGW